MKAIENQKKVSWLINYLHAWDGVCVHTRHYWVDAGTSYWAEPNRFLTGFTHTYNVLAI